MTGDTAIAAAAGYGLGVVRAARPERAAEAVLDAVDRGGDHGPEYAPLAAYDAGVRSPGTDATTPGASGPKRRPEAAIPTVRRARPSTWVARSRDKARTPPAPGGESHCDCQRPPGGGPRVARWPSAGLLEQERGPGSTRLILAFDVSPIQARHAGRMSPMAAGPDPGRLPGARPAEGGGCAGARCGPRTPSTRTSCSSRGPPHSSVSSSRPWALGPRPAGARRRLVGAGYHHRVDGGAGVLLLRAGVRR